MRRHRSSAVVAAHHTPDLYGDSGADLPRRRPHLGEPAATERTTRDEGERGHHQPGGQTDQSALRQLPAGASPRCGRPAANRRRRRRSAGTSSESTATVVDGVSTGRPASTGRAGTCPRRGRPRADLRADTDREARTGQPGGAPDRGVGDQQQLQHGQPDAAHDAGAGGAAQRGDPARVRQQRQREQQRPRRPAAHRPRPRPTAATRRRPVWDLDAKARLAQHTERRADDGDREAADQRADRVGRSPSPVPTTAVR